MKRHCFLVGSKGTGSYFEHVGRQVCIWFEICQLLVEAVSGESFSSLGATLSLKEEDVPSWGGLHPPKPPLLVSLVLRVKKQSAAHLFKLVARIYFTAGIEFVFRRRVDQFRLQGLQGGDLLPQLRDLYLGRVILAKVADLLRNLFLSFVQCD